MYANIHTPEMDGNSPTYNLRGQVTKKQNLGRRLTTRVLAGGEVGSCHVTMGAEF